MASIKYTDDLPKEDRSSVIREEHIETAFIEKLRSLKYIHRPDIHDRKSLEENFRQKFQELNRVELTDAEFSRLLDEIVTPDVFAASRALRAINSFMRDDGTPLNYTLVNIRDWCKNTFEVVNQLRINTDYSHHRYDVLILINGVPCVQIELKTLGVNPRRAMEQIVEYKNDPGNGYGRLHAVLPLPALPVGQLRDGDKERPDSAPFPVKPRHQRDMTYPYKPHQIEEFLRLEKCLPPGDTLELEKMSNGGMGRHFETRPQLVDGPFVDMRYLGKAPELDNPQTYDASFLLANQRVRGVGYEAIGRRRFRFKDRIPKGWHLNACDPNLPTNDPRQNVHHPMPDFKTTDFRDFINRTARMWNIDLGWEWEEGLL